MGCKRIPKKADRICTGDLKHLIKIIDRKIEPAEVSHTMNFDDYVSLRARVDTRKGGNFFNGVSTEDTPTHYFYIRFGPEVEVNYTIEFKDNYYNVSDIENLNEESRFLKISATKNGSKTKAANWS